MADDFDELQDSVACRLWDNDESVVEVILRNYAPAIEHCLQKKYAPVLIAEDIEDVVAFAVTKLWEIRAKYDDKKATVFTYLYTIADNKAKDILKNGWTNVMLHNPSNDDDSWTAMTAPPSEDVVDPKSPVQQKLLQDTREAFQKLPEIQQKLLFAKAMAGDGEVTSSLLAEEYCLPKSTVGVYLMRARDTMRTELRRKGHSL